MGAFVGMGGRIISEILPVRRDRALAAGFDGFDPVRRVAHSVGIGRMHAGGSSP